MTENTMNGSAFGLDSLDTVAASETGATMEVRDINGEVVRHKDGRPFTITLMGKDSPKFVQMTRAQMDRRIQVMQRTKKAATAAMMAADELDLFVAMTKSWDMADKDGNPIESKSETYRAYYTKYPALREQVDEFLGNRANFSKG